MRRRTGRSKRVRLGHGATLAALTAAAAVLGFAGFERMPQGGTWSVADSIYRTVQLFVLESGSVDPPVPWQLEVARLLAPAVTVYAAALAAIALFREQLRRLAVRLRARDHTIVAGLGSKGFRLARQLHEQGERVVAVERDPSAPAIAGCRERGIAVFVADAADPEILERAALSRARHLFVLCGDDGASADVLSAAQGATDGAARTVAAFVHLDDLDLWRHLQGHELASGSHPSLRTEFFNAADVGARLLLDHHPPFAPGEREPHVVVCGAHGIGESVVLHAARRWLGERDAGSALLRVTLCGDSAESDRARLLARHPRLATLCDLRAADPQRDGTAPGVAYVCVEPEARAASLALALRASLPATEVVAVVRDESQGIATTLGRESGVIPFGVLNRAMTSDLVLQGTTEVLARAKHDQYVRDEQRRGRTPESNPSMVAWHELDASLRRSNRRFAEGVGAKLRATGIAVLPAPLADPRAPAGALPEQQVEELAIDEHERWCKDLLADGWSHSPGPKDPERKLHPSLVPWDELSEEEREKDREPVRALPEMLAHAGFELQLALGLRGDLGADLGTPQPPGVRPEPDQVADA